MSKNKKHARTQWAGQFATALELTRRNYLVTFTLGNEPTTDLMCESPTERRLFKVQVKSLSSKTCFLCQERLLEPDKSLFFVFVFIPPVL